MRKVECLVTHADVREGVVYQVFKSTLQGVKVIDDVGDQYLLVEDEYDEVPADTPLGLIAKNSDIREQLKMLLKENLRVSIDRDRTSWGDSYDVSIYFDNELITTDSVTIDESKS